MENQKVPLLRLKGMNVIFHRRPSRVNTQPDMWYQVANPNRRVRVIGRNNRRGNVRLLPLSGSDVGVEFELRIIDFVQYYLPVTSNEVRNTQRTTRR